MTARLPALLTGRRRWVFAALVATGVGQAALAALTAVAMPLMLEASSTTTRLVSLALLVDGALALGYLRYLERSVAEVLSQDYVHQLRSGLVGSSLAGPGPSVGITVARTTNDLSSVRNWVALGIAPLATGIPVILGVAGVLAWLEPVLALAVVVPMVLLGTVLVVLARPAYRQARALRRHRGRLASHVADTVAAAPTIRAGGGASRELRRVDKLSAKVGGAAVQRARTAGVIRGTAAAAGSLALVSVAALGSWYTVSAGTLATSLLVVGVLVGPVGDLGRVVEYRQSYRAARRILAPALAVGATAAAAEARREAAADPAAGLPEHGPVRIRGLVVDGVTLPDLDAERGSRIVLPGGDPAMRHLLAALTGLATPTEGTISLSGTPLLDQPAARRRTLVGHASRDDTPERGTVARSVRYRVPDSTTDVGTLLDRVGLGEVVAALPDGERTTLRRGGEPLGSSEIARLFLARALLDDPPLLVLDHLDTRLGPAGLAQLRSSLADYPGVVIAATDQPEAFLDGFTRWAPAPVALSRA